MQGFFRKKCNFPKVKEHNIVIIGGGLAGLTAAIHLAIEGQEVAVFETNPYPHHRVCGEYVSKEIEPYLKRLGVDLYAHKAVAISQFEISTQEGYLVKTDLPLGGIGISRFAFDDLLYQRAKALGVTFYFEKVTEVVFQEDFFQITSADHELKAKITIGAYGKRSVLDKKLERDFSFKKQSWLAVKCHYEHPDFPEALVALHNFGGGYAGLSKTETGAVNFCYLVSYDSFKKHKDVDDFNSEVVSQNPYLREFFAKATPIFEHPLTIAQISFDKKAAVERHMLMCGDTAGLIHPLCGNGMAMAIHSAKLAVEVILKFSAMPELDRKRMEQEYQRKWNKTFRRRLWFGRKLQQVLMHRTWVNFGIKTIGQSDLLLKQIIKRTHGDSIQ